MLGKIHPYLIWLLVPYREGLHWDRKNRSRTGPVARQWHPSLQATRVIPRTLTFGLVVDPPTANGAAYQNSERNSDLRDDLTPPVTVSASLSAGWTSNSCVLVPSVSQPNARNAASSVKHRRIGFVDSLLFDQFPFFPPPFRWVN